MTFLLSIKRQLSSPVFMLLILSASSCKKDAPVIVITSVQSEIQTVDFEVVIDKKGNSIKEKGICWSTESIIPDIVNDDFQLFGNDGDDYTGQLLELESNETYNFRAFVTTKKGVTYYSETVSHSLDPAWVRSELITSDEFMSMDVLDSVTVHVGGKWGFYAYTEDGAETWTAYQPPLSFEIEHIQIGSADVAYHISYNNLRKSVDGGDTWNSQTFSSGGSTTAIQMIDADVGFAAKKSGLLLKTSDGFDSWSSVSVPIDASNTLEDLYFLTPTIGYGMTEDGNIFKSTDAGDSWVALNTVGVGYQSQSFIFTDETIGWIVDDKSVYKSEDGGYTWNEVYTSQNELWDISSIDPAMAYVCGDNGTIARTLDGGLSWEEMPLGTNTHINQIHMVDFNTGYACGSGYVWKYQ